MTQAFSDFSNRIAIISGGSSGLGLAISNELIAVGAHVVIFDIKEPSFLKETSRTSYFEIDITNEDTVKKTIDIVHNKFQQIDILINCAGITGVTNTKSHLTNTYNIKRVFDVNFMGSYYTSKHVLPYMLKRNYGRVLHIASIAGKEGNAGMLGYSASKAAVIGMTKVQGKEYAETGITINAIAPAVIQTPLVEAMPAEQVKYMVDKIPMKRLGTLAEIANAAIYIVSEKNSFTTGFTFDLSGGRATY